MIPSAGNRNPANADNSGMDGAALHPATLADSVRSVNATVPAEITEGPVDLDCAGARPTERAERQWALG